MKRKQERVRAGGTEAGMNGRGPGYCVERRGAGQHPCLTHWLGPCSIPHQSRLCSSLPEPLFLRKSAPTVAVGRWCCQATGGEGRVELDWEDCIADGQQEPARGSAGTLSV